MTDIGFTWTEYDTAGNVDSSVINVNNDGLVTGIGIGSSIVKAASEGVESNGVRIMVIGVPGIVEIMPLDVSEWNWSWAVPVVRSQAVAVGRSARVTGEVQDTTGNPISEASVSWVVENPTLANVDEDGLISGLSKGITQIRGTYTLQYDTLTYIIESAPLMLYVMDEVFREDFSGMTEVDTTKGFFISDDNVLWQLNYQLPTDTAAAGPKAGKFHFVEEGGEPVLMLTDPTTAYYANRQILIMNYGTTGYVDIDELNGWPDTTGMKTSRNWRVEFRMKGIDALDTELESLVLFTQYFSGATSPYYFVYAPSRERVTPWFGATIAPGARFPLIGSMPEITHDSWFNVVAEVFDGTMRTEIYTTPEPTGEWDYSYSIPDYIENEDYTPGLWIGSFNLDTLFVDDVRYYSP